MTFSEYQAKALNVNKCPQEFKLIHAVLGLVGEASEVAEKFKKLYRDKQGKMDKEFLACIDKEIGDVLWYCADLCTQLDLGLEDVAINNIQKLESRLQRGTLFGSGDNR